MKLSFARGPNEKMTVINKIGLASSFANTTLAQKVNEIKKIQKKRNTKFSRAVDCRAPLASADLVPAPVLRHLAALAAVLGVRGVHRVLPGEDTVQQPAYTSLFNLTGK